MSDKIIITEKDLGDQATAEQQDASPKMVFYGVPVSGSDALSRQTLSWQWYGIFLFPLVNLLAVGWLFAQRRYRMEYPVLCVCVSTLAAILLGWWLMPRAADEHWKNRLGEKAQSSVVMIDVEDRGWFLHETSLGTGVVVATDGDISLILTNRHVVTKDNGQVADALQVRDCRNRRYDARLVGLPRNPDIDMALIQVAGNDSLRVLGAIGDYEKLRTGDDVVAIGHPSGLNFTMTEGIVSALREGLLIQSSALINPGNSGGPLLNRQGQIVGINTFHIRNTQGLNFAFRADFILRGNAWNYFENISGLLATVTIQ